MTLSAATIVRVLAAGDTANATQIRPMEAQRAILRRPSVMEFEAAAIGVRQVSSRY